MRGGKANRPFVAAICCSFCANDRICSGSAVEDRTNSTGNWPPPGSAGGVTISSRIPGMLFTIPWIVGWIWNTVRFRSPQGWSTMPLKPLSGKVSWNVCAVSGTLANRLLTASA